MKLFELYAELGLDSSGFDQGIKKASKAGGGLASTLRSGLGGASNFVGKQISATTIMLGNLMTDVARKGVDMVKQTATAGIKYNSSMETYITNFTTMLGGSAEAAQQLTTDLEDMAASTPFAMSDLAGATNTLLAFGQDSETVLDTLENLGDISMGDANKLQSLTLAFAQASSSGKLMGQDLMQMINAGFNPLQTIADKTGASIADLKEFMSSGKATADLKKQMREAKREVKALGDNASDGAKMLVQMSQDGAISAELLGQIFELETSPGGRFYNAMKNASETFEGMVSTLEDDSNALLGKVFKPLSDWMTTDLLPNAISAIGQISDAFDEGGLEGAVGKAVEIASGYFSQLGQKARDAGSGLLANVLSGLTGDTVTGPEITAFFTGIWNDASGTADTFISTAGGVLKGIWDGITGDTGNKTNIVEELSGMWDGASGTLTSFTDAAGGLLGTIYEKITGQKATADEIGKTIGGLFSKGISGINLILNKSTNFMNDIAGSISGDTESKERIKKTFDDLFANVPAAMSTAIDNTGGFLSNLYERITGDKEGAAKLQSLFDTVGNNVEEAENEAGEVVSTAKEGAEAWGEVARYAGKKAKDFFVPLIKEETEDAMPWLEAGTKAIDEAGYTPVVEQAFTHNPDSYLPTGFSLGSAVEGWSNLGILLRDMFVPKETPITGHQIEWGMGYRGAMQRKSGTPFSQDQEQAPTGDLLAAVNALTAAASSLASDAASAAAGALNGAKVEMDGASVGRIVLPYVSQSMARGAKVMQKAHP